VFFVFPEVFFRETVMALDAGRVIPLEDWVNLPIKESVNR
jgi:hypothetical protein